MQGLEECKSILTEQGAGAKGNFWQPKNGQQDSFTTGWERTGTAEDGEVNRP